MSTANNTQEEIRIKESKQAWKTLPHVWALIKPQRGILALGFVLMAINRVTGLVLPASTKFLVDDVFGKRQIHLLAPIILIVLVATLVQGLSSFSLTQLLSKSAHRMIADLRRQVQAHIGHLPVTFYDTNKVGALVSRIMSDVEGLRNLIGAGLIEFVGALMTAIFALVVLLRISVFLTIVAVVVLVVFGVGLNQAFKAIQPIFRMRPEINAEVSGRLTESLNGVRVVKGYHAEEWEAKVFAAGVQRLLENVLRTLTATSVLNLFVAGLMALLSTLILRLGGRQVVSGAMTLGSFLTFTIFLSILLAPVFQTVGIGTQISEALAGLERVREVLNEKPEDELPGRNVCIGCIQGKIEFENVSFAYDSNKSVLSGIHFQTEPGMVTALVGPSGAGKSTIIGLIAAFYTPSSGRILIDDVDLATVRLDSYRTQLGVVLQETFLFDGTIRENVAFACPDASEEKVIAACRIARVDEFAETFEKKYNTLVGERGVKLSGGQKQRVSIARAIVANPRILILDEATSSLDSQSEALIQEGLQYLMVGRTTFVIAHRLSTIRSADQILVLETGSIVERGTHDSLYAKRERYYDLYTKQYGVEANLFLAPGEGPIDPDECCAPQKIHLMDCSHSS